MKYAGQTNAPKPTESQSHITDIAKVLYNAQRTEDELVFSFIYFVWFSFVFFFFLSCFGFFHLLVHFCVRWQSQHRRCIILKSILLYGREARKMLKLENYSMHEVSVCRNGKHRGR